MPLSLGRLPAEILLNIAGYLSNNDIATFIRVFPYMNTLVNERSFHRWQRQLGSFAKSLDSTFDAIEAEHRRRETNYIPVAASSLVNNIPECDNLENKIYPQVLSELQISNKDAQLQLDDIFLAFQGLGNQHRQPTPPFVECINPVEGSYKLRSALEAHGPLESIMALLPPSIKCNIDRISLVIMDRIIVTAYLLFTELQPNDLLDLLPRYSKDGYINEQVTAEYLSFLLLFLRVFRLDNAFWEGILRSSEDLAANRFNWVYANGSPISGSGLQILQKRIERWFVLYYSPKTQASQTIVLTDEQKAFVQSDISKGQIFKVRAYAGTGKTKCLVDYAKLRQRKKILYVAYNRQAKIDADFRFRDCRNNVDCKTLHSIAYNALAVVNPIVDRKVKGLSSEQNSRSNTSSRRGKFSRIQSAPSDNKFLRNWEIESVVSSLALTLDAIATVFTTPYNWPEPLSWTQQQFESKNKAASVGSATNPKNPENLARVITTTIDKFCQSNDEEISLLHFSVAQCRSKLCNPTMALPWVKKFWNIILSGESEMMSHDCYLKMFSLTTTTEADRTTFGKYDIVFFDEAQDANPCMANVILRQREASGIIIIGDPYQMIYGFRGAKNECFDDTKLPPTKTFHLTSSFRFGQDIADIANLILGTLGEKKPVKGVNSHVPSTTVFLPPVNSKFRPPLGKHTVIFRTNTELVKYFFASFANYPNMTMCLKTSATNAASAIIPLLRSGYYLYKGKNPKHPRLRGVKSFDEAKMYVQREDLPEGVDTDELDLQALGLVVGMERFYAENDDEGNFLNMLESSAGSIVDMETYADVVLTTAHQAKGLEWDNVIVADDFVTTGLRTANAGDQSWCRDQANLLYVACTRARKRLQVSNGLARFLTTRIATGRFFLSPLSRETLLCPCCKGMLPGKTFLSECLTATDASLGTDTENYFASKPSPCIGYEALIPSRDPSARDGWIDYSQKPLNPIDIPKCVYAAAIACVNCVLAWRAIANRTHGDLFRFAEGMKARISPMRDAWHSDFQVFWSGRFGPNTSGTIAYPGKRRSLIDVYYPGMRYGWEKSVNVGGIKESDLAWSDYVSKKASDSGIEYEDDELDDFIMGDHDSIVL